MSESVPGSDPSSVDPDDLRDELPEDLDLSNFVGPYTFPNNDRRRIPAVMYLVIGVGVAVVSQVVESPLVNNGLLWGGLGLALFGVYGLVTGSTMQIDETDALVAASITVGFPVGHASAQQVWRGFLSRPTWRILLYSAENPPLKRGIVQLDAISGEVREWFVEDNPEQWEGEVLTSVSSDRGSAPSEGVGTTAGTGDTADRADTEE